MAAIKTEQADVEVAPSVKDQGVTVVLPTLLVVTTIFCVLELAFQRGLSRMGNSLTMSGNFDPTVVSIFQVVDRVTGLSLNFAALFLIASLLLIVWQTLVAPSRLRLLRLAVCVGVVGLVVYSLYLVVARSFLRGSYATGPAYQLLGFGTLAVILLYAFLQADWRGRIIYALMFAAYACSAYNVLAQELLPTGTVGGLAVVYPLGQVFVLLAMAAIFVVRILPLRPVNRVALVITAVMMVIFTGLMLAPLKVDVPAYIAMFSSGFQFFLPLPVYVVALGLLIYSVSQAMRGTGRGWAGTTPLGLGLLLIAVGGYDLKLDIQFMQAALGLLLFSGFVRFDDGLLKAASTADKRMVA